MPAISRGILQAATVIAKTTQTLISKEIPCSGYETITLFLDYIKGDETGVIVIPYIMYSAGGTAYQDQSWSVAAGSKTITANNFLMTATGNHIIVMDVSGAEFVKFTQGGSNNDGTPTGTLAANYMLKGGVE